jgi:hypothetical protein
MSQAGGLRPSSSPGVVADIQGNTGGPVGPNGSNIIFLLGSGDLTVTGNPGTNTLTISSSGVAVWSTIGASQTLAVNSGYICTSGAVLALLLPATSALGDIIEITLDGSTGFSITQAAGQQIRIGNATTTSGAGGSLSSNLPGNTVRMVCQTANLKWNVLSSIGNLTVV